MIPPGRMLAVVFPFFFCFLSHNGGPNCCQIGQARAAFHAASGNRKQFIRLCGHFALSSGSFVFRLLGRQPVADRRVYSQGQHIQ